MRWSWKIGSIAGVPIHLHFTLIALMAWFLLQYWAAGHSLPVAMAGIGFTSAIFVCILLHELGHAWVARRFGIRTRDITLLPFGGLARLERLPEHPRHEIAVAVAGPMVNVAIAVALFVAGSAIGVMRPVAELTMAGGPFVERLMIANLVLAGFNLLPALPMDGGRILRAALAMRYGNRKATLVASNVAKGMAVVFAVAGAFLSPWLMLIALFVWLGATFEAAETETRSVLGGVAVKAAMITEFRSLNVLDTPEQAMSAILSGSQRDFPVLHGERLAGVLTQQDLLSALASAEAPVMHLGQIIRREYATFAPDDALGDAVPRLMSSSQGCYPVMIGDRVVGLLTIDNVLEFLAFRRVLQEREAVAEAA